MDIDNLTELGRSSVGTLEVSMLRTSGIHPKTRSQRAIVILSAFRKPKEVVLISAT